MLPLEATHASVWGTDHHREGCASGATESRAGVGAAGRRHHRAAMGSDRCRGRRKLVSRPTGFLARIGPGAMIQGEWHRLLLPRYSD